ncbi:MAG: type I-C CRISPR-associated protein Cas8c/Csd1, partial [Clostridia bacterium]|nr:type I-C CRISPR-associated protein Cas8c/Csd1 [Clostridia bacterium]
RLINLSQHHLSKLNMGKYIAYEKLLQDIMVDMTGFPEVLSLKQQGDFVLGYYQQKQTFFISKNKTEGEDE